VIDHPPEGSVVVAGNHLAFSGHASDPTDGVLTGGALVWRSDLDGVLGTGTMLVLVVNAGTYVITLTATDSLGLSASAQIHLTAQ
jgi:hypothetical protein